MVDNSMLFAGFVFVLRLIWGGVASFLVLLPIGVSHWWWWLGMAMGWGGRGSKGWGLHPRPTSHSFVLPHPRITPHDRKNFLAPSLPLGAPQILAPPCKTMLFVNFPLTITIVFNKT